MKKHSFRRNLSNKQGILFYSISLGKIIDEALGIHNSAYYGYQYNEIMLVHLEMKSILFC